MLFQAKENFKIEINYKRNNFADIKVIDKISIGNLVKLWNNGSMFQS